MTYFAINQEEEIYIEIESEKIKDAEDIIEQHNFEYDLVTTDRPQGRNWVRIMQLESFYE